MLIPSTIFSEIWKIQFAYLDRKKTTLNLVGPNPNISSFETSGHIDHQMSSPVGRTAMIVRQVDSQINCCLFETILSFL